MSNIMRCGPVACNKAVWLIIHSNTVVAVEMNDGRYCLLLSGFNILLVKGGSL